MTAMRLGFASIYAWRPHVEHLVFLARLAEQGGQHVSFLACDADLPACYTRELRDVRPDWLECMLCRIGGVRSYAADNVASLGELAVQAPHHEPAIERLQAWAASSASTLGRFESATDYASADFAALRDRLLPSVAAAYRAARAWIERERLDAVCLFNGRMDATRGVFEAARDAGIRVVSVERSWFGDGLQLLPDEHCLGLGAIHEMVATWRERPLTAVQARQAAARVAARLTGTNTTEWRAYNTRACEGEWPRVDAARRILLLPGSLNEVWGHEGWQSGWQEPTAAYDALISHLHLAPADLVLRCHPNWGERIGKNDGRLPERYYTDWAHACGIHVIGSHESASTMRLIEQCDAVVLASGSAALEAAALGKQVISIGPSTYQEAGFRTDVGDPSKLTSLRLDVDLPEDQQRHAQRRLRRLALRFGCTMTRRLPQYVDHVRALSSSAYRYPPGADPTRFLELVRTGRLTADDASFAADESAEDEVLERMEAGDWASLTAPPAPDDVSQPRVQRRWFLRPVDYVRDKMPVGDR